MSKNLVIVESPAKAKTIEKFLGADYVVRSSFGHVRDLAKHGMGIDIEHGFEPAYEVSEEKKKVVAELTREARKADAVWLASDEDREGEAIAWHLTQVLNLPVESTRRIVFHEITKNAILGAIEKPRTVDMNLVDAQQARRILDRLVGFELSPLLWRKVRPSLSAGRVQSVTVRLLVEREREIMAFASAQYSRVTAEFEAGGVAFGAEYSERFKTEQEARAFLEQLIGATYSVGSVEKKPGTRSPAAPFTTSTLQQEAGRKLSMSVAQTMSTAQRLYEHGLITYMRTDSVNLSSQAIAAAKAVIESTFGEKYSHPRTYKTKSKGAQEAHEAIRPSYMDREEIEGTPAERRLYDLIRKRTLASQMAAAEIEKTVVGIDISSVSDSRFVATGEVILFDGFLKLYTESVDEDAAEEDGGKLPLLKQGDALSALSVTATQKFTQSPPRYSEATLVRRLEELGIGRPSTYAPTISTVINRGYVVKGNRDGVKREYVLMTLKGGRIASKTASETVGKEKNKLSPTDIGMVVTDYLSADFSGIMDYNFTANVEKEFDDIAEGKLGWRAMLGDFYNPFHTSVAEALVEKTRHTAQARVLGIDPVSGREVSARVGKFGPLVQIEAPEGEKPRYASMKKGQLIASITLEQALELFALPRNLGQIDGKDVVIGIGKFGPYARHDGKFTSLGRDHDPYTITLEEAASLIAEKAAAKAAAAIPLRIFDEVDPPLQILNGRYGPYVPFEGKNYTIPRAHDIAALTIDDVRTIIAKKKK